MFQGITFPFSHIVHHKSIPIPLTSLLITQLTFLLVSKALRSALLFYRWIRMPSLPFIVVYFTISLHSCHFHFKKFYRRQFDFIFMCFFFAHFDETRALLATSVKNVNFALTPRWLLFQPQLFLTLTERGTVEGRERKSTKIRTS